MLIGIIAGIIWELRQKEPVVDLKMLKDRNFAISTLAMFFLGFVLYSSTVLIPQFLQDMLGYTAELAGMALSPGGLVIMLMMPVVGILVSKVDTRILITFGCTVCAIALFWMAGWDLNLDYSHAVRARMLQSFGLAFLFIPINVAAFAYVPREKTNMGTGIINLARNIGASVGIATVTTMLERRAQFHQAHLIESVNSLNPALLKNDEWQHAASDFLRIERFAGGDAGEGDGLQPGAEPVGDAGVHRQFQDAGSGISRCDSSVVDDAEAESGQPEAFRCTEGRRCPCIRLTKLLQRFFAVTSGSDFVQ